jgi:hypothetical protein
MYVCGAKCVELDCINLEGKSCGSVLYMFGWANCVELYCIVLGANCVDQDYVGLGGKLCGTELYNFGCEVVWNWTVNFWVQIVWNFIL